MLADPALSNRQRAVLLDVYESFVGVPIRPTKPRPAKTPAHHSPDPAVNTTKEN